MKQFLKFFTKIKSFWKFYQNYEYDGEDVEFIIDNYEGGAVKPDKDYEQANILPRRCFEGT